MGRRRQAMPGLRRPWVSQETVGDAGYFVNALFKSSIMGVAICDRKLRFCALNGALAVMNGLPAALHIGKTIHAVLGSAAAKIQPAFEHVFATGEPLSNFELTAELPTRGVVGHWHESYFPIKDEIGRVQQVGAIVLEITKRNELDVAIMRLITKLTGMRSTLRRDSGGLEISDEACGKSTEVFARSAAELESCLLEARSISQLLHDAGSAMPAHRACMPLQKRPEEEGQAFALA